MLTVIESNNLAVFMRAISHPTRLQKSIAVDKKS